MSIYRTSMSSPVAMSSYSRTLWLPENNLSVFLYDSNPEANLAGRPLLLLHGLGDEADTWRLVWPALIEHQRVLALDWPGFGRSELPAKLPPSAPEFYLSVLIELIETLRLSPLILIGHSMGAMLAQAFAMTYPERLSHLVLIGGGLVTTGQKPDPLLLAFLVPGLGEWLYTRLRRDPQAAFRTLEPFYADLSGLPEIEQKFLFERVNQRVWSDRQRRAYFYALRGLARWLPKMQKRFTAILANWALPTTIVWGERDRINSPMSGKALANLLPQAQFEIIPGAGHNLQQERPELLVQMLNETLAKVR